MIDLRSDTVTRPTPAMRRAMAEAEVGDDVFGEDPTVRRLEEAVAEILGKGAALFVPSGVMGNQVAVHVHTQPGDEVIVAERSHIFHYEGGGPAALSGVQLRPVGDDTGVLSPDDVANAVRGGHDWEPRTRLLCLENTVNKAGGVVIEVERLQETVSAARQHNLRAHLDGARLWNAAVALDRPPADIAAPFDTVNVCLSKALGAPVGSVLAGSADLMAEARRVRKLFGGGMRQAGVLAAAGLLALDHRPHLADDHARTQRLGEAIAETKGLRLVRPPQSNILLFDTLDQSAEDFLSRLAEHDVQMVAFGPQTIRATLHRDISDADLDRTIQAVRHAA